MKTIFVCAFTVMSFVIGCNAGDNKGFTVPFTPSNNLEADFQTPPDYARTRAYWWWLEGYITKRGIIDDHTAMKEAGILGAIIFDAGNSSNR